MVTGGLVVVIFVVIAALMISKKLPTVLALPLMAVLIAIVAGLPLKGDEGILTFVISQGSLKLAGTYVAILFSCWLSRILYRTGVSATIIKKAAELGGDKPFVVSLLLCVASVFLFTVLYGTGAVAMVGAIVLPIMLSVGVAPTIACNSFLAAMTAGYMINPANIAAITNITGVEQSDMYTAAIILTVMSCIFCVGILVWGFKKGGTKYAFASEISTDDSEEIEPVKGFRGFLACMTPFVVVLIMLVFKLDAITVFMIGIVWLMVMTVKGNWSKYCSMIVQSCYEGFKEGAPTVALMFGIGMLINAMTAPTTQAAIQPFMQMITPTTAIGLILFVCILSPGSLYRGPFNILGLGAGLAVSMMAVNAVPILALSVAFYATMRWPTQACPTSTQVVWCSNFVGYEPTAVAMKVFWPNWIVTALSVVILVMMYM